MKTFEIALRLDGPGAEVETRRIQANTLAEAMEEIPPRAVVRFWRVVPTAKQIRKTKNLLRCL